MKKIERKEQREGREREGQREGQRERTKKEGMRMGPNVDCRGGKDRERRGERGRPSGIMNKKI